MAPFPLRTWVFNSPCFMALWKLRRAFNQRVTEPRAENAQLSCNIHEKLCGRGDIWTMPKKDEVGNFHSTVSVEGQRV